MDSLKCDICSKTFSRLDSLKRHAKVHIKDNIKTYKCTRCDVTSAYNMNIKRHMEKVHGLDVPSSLINQDNARMSTSPVVEPQPSTSRNNQTNTKMMQCVECNISIPENKMAGHRRTTSHKAKCSTVFFEDGVELMQSAFKNNIATYRVKGMDESNMDSSLSVECYFQSIKEQVLRLLRFLLTQHTSIKIYMELFGWYILPTKDQIEGDIKQEIKSFNSAYQIITPGTDLDELYNHFCERLKIKSEEFQQRESGWSLVSLMHLEINVAKYNPLRASTFIPLPKQIVDRKAVINVRNSDTKCFCIAF